MPIKPINSPESQPDDDPENKLTPPELPPPFRGIISEEVKVYGVDPDLPTLIALATASAAIGKGFILDAPPHMTLANLFAIPSAPSGSGKSLTFREITDPLFDADQKLVEEWNQERLPQLIAEQKKLKAEETKLLRNLTKDENDSYHDQQRLEEIAFRSAEIERQLIPPRIVAEDVTTQKLATLLEGNNETLAVFSSEAGDVVSNIAGRYSANGRTDEHLYLKGFSGDKCRVDRIGRESVTLSKPCLSICWVITPDELEGLFSNPRFVSGGLLPRILICRSRSDPMIDENIARHSDTEIIGTWHRSIHAVLQMRNSCSVVQQTDESMAVFRNYGNKAAKRFKKEPELASFNARRREIAQKIALTIHVMQHGANVENTMMEPATARIACELSSYYSQAHMGHIQRGTLEYDMKDIERISMTARKFGAPHAEGDAISLRDIYRHNGMPRERVELLAERYPDELKIETTNPQKGRPATLAIMLGN